MEILFLILKIIGILLAVCMLLLGAALTVPVRYRVHAEIYQDASGFAVFSWLFHIVDVRIWYEKNKLVHKLRIFGIPIGFKRERDSTPLRQEKKNSQTVLEAQELSEINKDTKEIEQEETNRTETNRTEMNRTETSPADGAGSESKKRSPVLYIREAYSNIKQRVSSALEGARTLKEKIKNIKDMILDETNKRAVGRLWQETRYLIRHYSPRKVTGEIAFGMGDPSQTGQVLGVISMLPFWARYKINVYPDFEAEKIFAEGKLQMKGYIRLWHFMLSFIRLFKDKNIRQAWKNIRA